jgi:fructokinase
MNIREVPVCLFGEVLFDHFPDGSRVLGGAPFNVAWHLQAFGQSPRLVTRIGNDTEGGQVLAAMRGWGMDTSGVQIDPDRPTGRVAVSFVDGEPGYHIVPDCAYDAIEPAATPPCRLLYHGSLALRAATSAATLRQLRAAQSATVFIDVNLRPPWYEPALVRELLAGADWVKLNVDELALLGGTGVQPAREFLQCHALQGLLVTHGARGAELVLADGGKLQAAPAAGVEVVDTVGAGDAFSAVMLLGLLHHWAMPEALARAQQFAAAVVGRRGATVSEPGFYRAFSQQWQTAG